MAIEAIDPLISVKMVWVATYTASAGEEDQDEASSGDGRRGGKGSLARVLR